MLSDPEADWLSLGVDEPAAEQKAIEEAVELASRAIRGGELEALSRVFADCPELANNFLWGPPLLLQAAELGQAGALTVLLGSGIPVDWVDESGGTALTAAAWAGHAEVVRVLLAAGADPNLLGEDSWREDDPSAIGLSALYFAVYQGHREVIEILEPVTRPDLRLLAHEAVRRRREDEAIDELENGPRMSDATKMLYIAVQNRRLDQLREAIDAGGDINAVLEPGATNRLTGGTPLSFAASSGRMDLVMPLLEAGADPELPSAGGLTPAEYADIHEHAAVAEALRGARQLRGDEVN